MYSLHEHHIIKRVVLNFRGININFSYIKISQKNVLFKDKQVLWSSDIKTQEAFYRENVNRGDVLQSMPVFICNNFSSSDTCALYINIKDSCLCLFVCLSVLLPFLSNVIPGTSTNTESINTQKFIGYPEVTRRSRRMCRFSYIMPQEAHVMS